MPLALKFRDNKNIKEKAEKKISKMSTVEMDKAIADDYGAMAANNEDLLSVWCFFHYLIDGRKDKAFATHDWTIVAKNKKVLEKRHNVKIVILDEPEGRE